MAEKLPFRIRELTKALAGTYDYVETDPVPAGEIWCLQGYQIENETGARGTMRVYISGHGYEHWLLMQASPSAATLYGSDDVDYLTPGERLVLRQASCVANDVLALYTQGYIVHSKFVDGEV